MLTGSDNLRNLAQTWTPETWGGRGWWSWASTGPWEKVGLIKGVQRPPRQRSLSPLLHKSRPLSTTSNTVEIVGIMLLKTGCWGNLLLFTEEMSTNLAGDINKYEIIYLVLTYVMNGLHLTVSIARCPDPGSGVLLLGSTGALGALLLKTPTFLSAKISTRHFSTLSFRI